MRYIVLKIFHCFHTFTGLKFTPSLSTNINAFDYNTTTSICRDIIITMCMGKPIYVSNMSVTLFKST